MNQRINPETGYPMSTDKQIKIKKEALSVTKAFHEENPHEAGIKLLKELSSLIKLVSILLAYLVQKQNFITKWDYGMKLKMNIFKFSI